MSRWALELEEYAAFPKSAPEPLSTDVRLQRHARINYLGEVPDGSGRTYVPDLNGMLYLVDAGDVIPYLDVRAAFAPDFAASVGLGNGFGFVAFHPEFADNGKFYTVHTEADAALVNRVPDLTSQPEAAFHGVVTEWIADYPLANQFSGTKRELLRLGFQGRIHGIQQLGFNPNSQPGDEDYGLLYVAVGDGGLGIRSDTPQNLAVPQGKLLRLDPAGNDSDNGKYGIPVGNPFVERRGALGEIYAYGLRDPHRFSWDSQGDQRMFLGHIGEHEIEMIYDVLPGDNFGWSQREGRFVYDQARPCQLFPLPRDDARYGYVYPLAEYDQNRSPELPCNVDAGHAISGGFMYRGPVGPLRGKYIFGDLVDGRVMYVEGKELQRKAGRRATIHELTVIESGRQLSMPQLVGDARVDLRFGTDSKNDLYLLAKANGKVWKVTGVQELDRSLAVFPGIASNLEVYYDFEHPAPDDPTRELDQGRSHSDLRLLNGGQRMRTRDGAYAASRSSLQFEQVAPQRKGNDDWKAGFFEKDGAPSLARFNGTKGVTFMGWVKMTGDGPALNSNTPDPGDRYNAIGIAGLLSGTSDGHAVRAMLELLNVDGVLRLVALARRLDDGRSQQFAASQDWHELLPIGQWVHVAASADFNSGRLRLYRNGRPLAGSYTQKDDPWGISAGEDFASSATNPRGIKVGGSFPQNTEEKNPCHCRMDDLMFLDRAVTQLEVNQQYRWALSSARAGPEHARQSH